MSLGFRILNSIRRPRKELVESFRDMPVAIISDNLNRMFAGGARIRPMHKGGQLLGTAVTVKTRPGDNLMIHKAVDIAGAGDVIVVDGGGDLINSLIGELIISHAMSRGIAGFIVDGAVRDLDFIAEGVYPIYGCGVTHRGPYKEGPGEVNVPIAIDGMVVNPGDIMVGDLDGFIAVPQDEADAIRVLSLRQMRREKDTMVAIKGDGWNRDWVDEILRARGCEDMG
jgi:regulator of RNase E activity RraA